MSVPISISTQGLVQVLQYFRSNVLAFICLSFISSFALAQSAEDLFNTTCAVCHVQQADDKIPSLDTLQSMSANAILVALEDGAMRIQGSTITAEQRVSISEYLSGEAVIERPIEFEVGMCESLPAITTPATGTVWSGWGMDEKNSRYQTETGGLSAADVPHLSLKWAFGVPDVQSVRSQPAIYGDRLFVGSLSGAVFSLNAETGCTYWSYKTQSGVRTSIEVAEIDVEGKTTTAIFFNDQKANAYALNAETGAEIWITKVDDHSAASGTGALKYHDGVVYVPTSGLPEEGIAFGTPDYECCTYRGSVSALDANTGEKIWQTFTMPEPQVVEVLEDGRKIWGPAGGAVWNSPTVDDERNLVYFAVGNAYAGPFTETSNSIMAVDKDNGNVVWVNQVLAGDIWSGGCYAALGGNADNPGCPDVVGPDFDFSASPVLTTLANGKDVILATQKSGQGYAFDPDDNGKTLWTYRWGVGAAEGGVYGTASDGERVYFAVADNWKEKPGGLHAVDIASGERVWFTPPGDLLCNPQTMGCSPTQSAAVTVMEGVVFSGSADGGLRAYSATTGDVIWTYDTNHSFDTVNGVPANGGSIDGPGVVIANGMVYVSAGNGGVFGSPGNVLLAFSINGQ